MSTALFEKQESAVTHKAAGKFLTFCLGKEEFAVRVLNVREIIGIQDITTVPQTPAFVKGVINLRGKVIPVVNLRLRFGIEEREYDDRTCIVVAEVDRVLIGLIVDTVEEVMETGRVISLPAIVASTVISPECVTLTSW